MTLLLAAGCGDKQEKEQAPKQTDGIETSWTGYLWKTYPCDLDLCVSAAKSALQRLNVKLVDESGGIFKKTLKAEGSDGTSIGVQVAEVTKTTAHVSIKVGYLLGDKDAARRIHSEIESELGTHRQAEHKWRSFSSFGDMAQPTPRAPTSKTP